MRPPQAFRSVAVLLGCVLLLSGGGSFVATGSNRNSPTGWDMVTVIAVGDSITTGGSTDFDAGRIGQGSWATYAGGDGVEIVGGWAHAGATTSDMLAGLADPGTRSQADVLVLMAGNNDVDAGSAPEQIEQGLVQIVRTVHVNRVILSTLAPEDTAGAEVEQVNALLPALAQEQGW